MKTLTIILCLCILLIPIPSVAQDDTHTLKALNLGPVWGDIVWNTQGDLFAVGGYSRITIQDANFQVIATLENYAPRTDFAWSPAGDLFFVTLHDATYQIVRRSPEGELTTLYDNQRESTINNLSINHDATYLAGIEDGRAKIWSIATGEGQRIAETKDFTALAVAWHPTQPWLAIANGSTIYVWDMASAELVKRLDLAKHIDFLTTLSWNSASDVLALGGQGIVYLWSLESDELVSLAGHSDIVNHLTWLDGGEQLISASEDGAVKIWDVATATVLIDLDMPAGMKTLALQSTTGYAYILDKTNIMTIFDIKNDEILSHYYGYVIPQQQIWTADGSAITNGELRWDVATGEISQLNPTEPLAWSSSAQSFAWNPTGTQVASVNADGLATVSEGDTVLYELSEPANYFAWSPDGMWLATYAEDSSTVNIWQGEEIETILQGFSDVDYTVVDLSWASNGQQVALVGLSRDNFDDTLVRVYDVTTGELQTDTGFILTAISVNWSADDAQLLVNTERYGLQIFASTTGASLREFPTPMYSTELSPDGSRFVAKFNPPYENTTLGIYDTTTLESISEVSFDYQTDFGNFTWSPDGTQVAVVLEGIFYVWEP